MDGGRSYNEWPVQLLRGGFSEEPGQMKGLPEMYSLPEMYMYSNTKSMILLK